MNDISNKCFTQRQSVVEIKPQEKISERTSLSPLHVQLYLQQENKTKKKKKKRTPFNIDH